MGQGADVKGVRELGEGLGLQAGQGTLHCAANWVWVPDAGQRGDAGVGSGAYIDAIHVSPPPTVPCSKSTMSAPCWSSRGL